MNFNLVLAMPALEFGYFDGLFALAKNLLWLFRPFVVSARRIFQPRFTVV